MILQQIFQRAVVINQEKYDDLALVLPKGETAYTHGLSWKEVSLAVQLNQVERVLLLLSTEPELLSRTLEDTEKKDTIIHMMCQVREPRVAEIDQQFPSS